MNDLVFFNELFSIYSSLSQFVLSATKKILLDIEFVLWLVLVHSVYSISRSGLLW